MKKKSLFEELQTFLNEYGFRYNSQDEAVQAFMEQQGKSKFVDNNIIDNAIDEIEELAGGSPLIFLRELAKLEQEQTKLLQANKMKDLEGYLALKMVLADLYLDHCLNVPSCQHYEDILTIVPEDYFGVRYRLMLLYYRMGKIENMEIIMKNYEAEYDSTLLLLMIIGYVSQLQDTKARKLVKKLYQLDAESFSLFQAPNLDFISESTLFDEEDPTSPIFELFPFIIDTLSDYIVEWINTEVYQLEQQSKKISKPSPVITLHNPIFLQISPTQQKKLQNLALTTKDDFKQITEQELLNCKISQKTIRQLKNNGVIFHK